MIKLFLTIVILCLIGCSEKNITIVKTSDDRPDNVPDKAFWQGGVDGGAWYECYKTVKVFRYHCTIYNDYTGNITIKDDFDLYISTDKNQVSLKDYLNMKQLSANEINFFDGDNLHLQGTLVLRPSNGQID